VRDVGLYIDWVLTCRSRLGYCCCKCREGGAVKNSFVWSLITFLALMMLIVGVMGAAGAFTPVPSGKVKACRFAGYDTAVADRMRVVYCANESDLVLYAVEVEP